MLLARSDNKSKIGDGFGPRIDVDLWLQISTAIDEALCMVLEYFLLSDFYASD